MKKIRKTLVFLLAMLFSTMFLQVFTSAKTLSTRMEFSVSTISTSNYNGKNAIELSNEQLKSAYNGLTTYTGSLGINSSLSFAGEVEVYKFKADSNEYYSFYTEQLYRIDGRSNSIYYWGLKDSIIKVYEVTLNILNNFKSAKEVKYNDDGSLSDPTANQADVIYKAKKNTYYLVCIRGYYLNIGEYKLVIEKNKDYCLQSKDKNYWTYTAGTHIYDEIYYLNQEQTLLLYALLYGFVDEKENIVVNADYFKSNRTKAMDKLHEFLGMVLDVVDDTGILSMVLNDIYKSSDYKKVNKQKVLDYIRDNCAISETYEDGPIGSGEGTYTITINKGIIIYAYKISSTTPILSFGIWNENQPRCLFKGVEGATGTWRKA